MRKEIYSLWCIATSTYLKPNLESYCRLLYAYINLLSVGPGFASISPDCNSKRNFSNRIHRLRVGPGGNISRLVLWTLTWNLVGFSWVSKTKKLEYPRCNVASLQIIFLECQCQRVYTVEIGNSYVNIRPLRVARYPWWYIVISEITTLKP